jgi:ribulose 1,5-bisphosphate carboxylase large subunit-like protein
MKKSSKGNFGGFLIGHKNGKRAGAFLKAYRKALDRFKNIRYNIGRTNR